MNKILCVDVLNFPREFGLDTMLWSVTELQLNVARFVKAAADSGIKVVAFLDAGKQSRETADTWKSRVAAKLKREAIDCAPSVQMLTGEIFKELQVSVYYSTSAIDCDDAIASYAHHQSGDILSGDRDFFRYPGRKYTVYKSFDYKADGTLNLTRRPFVRMLAPRKMLAFEDTMARLSTDAPNFEEVLSKRTYSRGMASSLIKYAGNPHASLADLRSSVYAKLGVPLTDVVTETFPAWDSEEYVVFWETNKVKPSHEFDNLFCLPFAELCKKYTRNIIVSADGDNNTIPEFEWANHFLAFKLLLAELCAVMQGKTLLSFLADHIASENAHRPLPKEALTQAPKLCKQWREQGMCKFGEKCWSASGHGTCKAEANCRRGAFNCLFYHPAVATASSSSSTSTNWRRKN